MNSTKHLKRWIVASFLKELKLHSDGVFLYLEGDDQLTNKETKHLELRIDGPYMRTVGTRNEQCAYIEVNLLANSTRNKNRFDRQNLQGLMAFMLNRDVCIYRTGNEGSEPADDGQQVGVMQLLPVDMIKTSDFGQIDPNTQVYQSVSEAHYEMYFTGQ